MNGLLVSDIEEDDLHEIFALANKVIEEHVFPTLSKEGRNTIRNTLNKDTSDILNKELYQALKVEMDSKIVGYIAWRHGYHIAQLYVDSEYQSKGIGTLLVNEVIKRSNSSLLKVRASLNAVQFYMKIGFIPVGNESVINGIKFLPMEFKICT